MRSDDGRCLRCLFDSVTWSLSRPELLAVGLPLRIYLRSAASTVLSILNGSGDGSVDFMVIAADIEKTGDEWCRPSSDM